MSRSQRKPLTKDELQRVQTLLKDTNLSMTTIGERMNCARSSIARINKEFRVRIYKGKRKKWETADDAVTSDL